jgi:manganese transport protein
VATVELLAPQSRLAETLRRGRARAALAILGPAFVASVAYVDPGNFATNFAAGGEHGYLLVWVVVMADLMAVLVQYATSKAGLLSGKSLPELCQQRFGRKMNFVLWLQAEVIAMATDLAEFVGAALGLHLVFGVALFPAGLLTAVIAFAILALDRRGYRRFELAVVALLAFVATGLLVDLFTVGHQSAAGIAGGLVPHLGGNGTLALAVAIIGATVMPHAVYLHSALQKDRIRPTDDGEKCILLRYNRWDCALGLGIAGLANVAMVCIAAGLFHHLRLTGATSLGSVHADLATMVGGLTALAFGVALMASGFSSSSVGTYAGQVVMAGFMGWRSPLILRRAITMVPSLVVLGLAVNPSSALVLSQVVLSFGIPFVLLPLVLITRQRDIFGAMVNQRLTNAGLWAATLTITALNVYLVGTTLARL